MTTVLATGTVLRAGSQPVLVPTGPAGPDHPLALELHGQDLPPPGSRAVIQGQLTGRSLHASQWQLEPQSTSALPDTVGTDQATAYAVADSVSEDWSLISVGVSTTAANKKVVVLEVERATPEIRDWLEKQPLASVHLVEFITSGVDT